MTRPSTLGLVIALGACTVTRTTDTVRADSGVNGGCPQPCADGRACVSDQCVDLCALAGRVRCDGGCADPSSDSSNCGACGIVCPNGESCLEARCSGPCPVGQARCGDAGCFDLQGDFHHCGSCDIACGASQSCLSGACQATPCESPLLSCGPEAAPRCVDPRNDPDNCGGCDVVCGEEGTCFGGGCGCYPGSANCGGDGGIACPDLTSDLQNCGACGAACVSCETCSASSCAIDPFRLGAPLPVPPGHGWLLVSDLFEGDFNGDGVPDLAAISNEYPSNEWGIFWWSGLPDGGFQLERPFEPDSGLFEATAEVADFNGDGVDDVAILESDWEGDVETTRRLSVLLGSRASGFSSGFAMTVADGGNAWNLAIGDLNADGLPDLVLMSGDITVSDFTASIYTNTGDGGFALTAQIPIQDQGQMSIADVNGDGRADLVGGGQVNLQLPDGGFGPPFGVYWLFDVEEIDAYGTGGTQLLATEGDGVELITFADGGVSEVLSAWTGPSSFLFSRSVIADLNGDGIPDVASAGEVLGLFFRHGDTFDYSISDAGSVGYVAVIPGDAGARLATGIFGAGAPGVYVSSPLCR